MSLKTVLAIFQNENDAPAIVDAATQLAKVHEAHITGLYVTASPEVYFPGVVPISVELIEQNEQREKATADEIHKAFDDATKSENLLAEWREVLSSPMPVTTIMQTLANTADIVVLGQQTEGTSEKVNNDLAERMVLAAGRPVLVVPASGHAEALHDTVFVAWDGSRESSRAAFDSLPILCKANQVTLLTINPKAEDKHNMFAPSADLVAALSRHGVNVKLMQTHAGRTDIGAEILYSIKDNGANLLVMGAYGSSRVRELLFGGVTKEVLDEMPIPVLMSH